MNILKNINLYLKKLDLFFFFFEFSNFLFLDRILSFILGNLVC